MTGGCAGSDFRPFDQVFHRWAGPNQPVAGDQLGACVSRWSGASVHTAGFTEGTPTGQKRGNSVPPKVYIVPISISPSFGSSPVLFRNSTVFSSFTKKSIHLVLR